MQKPSSLLYEEFQEELQKLLNTTGLPAFVLLPVMREAIRQLEEIERRQLQRDMEEWESCCDAPSDEADGKEVSEDGEQTNQPV